MLVNNTPIEIHGIGYPVHVKRDDLCSPYPGPSFSKIRGVVEHIRNRPEEVIGVLDTAHSKAGWAVSYVCRHLGKRCVNYWPRRVSEGPNPRHFQQEAEKNGARLVELKAGRSSVLYHQARKHLRDVIGESYLMPNALKLPESVAANAEEARRTLDNPLMPRTGTVVISISSGTVAAGVMLGLRSAKDLRFILHMGYSRSQDATRAYIESCAPGTPWDRVTFVDEGYGYADSAKPSILPCPFPTNPFYDGKAWRWLTKDAPYFTTPVIFWNIGD